MFPAAFEYPDGGVFVSHMVFVKFVYQKASFPIDVTPLPITADVNFLQ